MAASMRETDLREKSALKFAKATKKKAGTIMSEMSLNISEIDSTPPDDGGLADALDASWDELANDDGDYPYGEAFGQQDVEGFGPFANDVGGGESQAGPAYENDTLGDFTAEEREAFASLTPEAQSLVASYAARSQASRSGLANELDGLRRQFGSLGETLNQYAPYMQMLGASPDQVVAGIMPYYLRLAGGDAETRRETIDFLARQFGVDSAQRTGQNADPQMTALRNEVNALKQHRAASQQAAYAQLLGGAQQNVDVFASARDENGALKYPDFDRLEGAMVGLMQGGIARDLDDAYAKAAALDPDLQAAALTGRTATARRRAADAARAAKRAASVNRRGRNAPAAQRLALTIDDSISEAWDELYG